MSRRSQRRPIPKFQWGCVPLAAGAEIHVATHRTSVRRRVPESTAPSGNHQRALAPAVRRWESLDLALVGYFPEAENNFAHLQKICRKYMDAVACIFLGLYAQDIILFFALTLAL